MIHMPSDGELVAACIAIAAVGAVAGSLLTVAVVWLLLSRDAVRHRIANSPHRRRSNRSPDSARCSRSE